MMFFSSLKSQSWLGWLFPQNNPPDPMQIAKGRLVQEQLPPIHHKTVAFRPSSFFQAWNPKVAVWSIEAEGGQEYCWKGQTFATATKLFSSLYKQYGCTLRFSSSGGKDFFVHREGVEDCEVPQERLYQTLAEKVRPVRKVSRFLEGGSAGRMMILAGFFASGAFAANSPPTAVSGGTLDFYGTIGETFSLDPRPLFADPDADILEFSISGGLPTGLTLQTSNWQLQDRVVFGSNPQWTGFSHDGNVLQILNGLNLLTFNITEAPFSSLGSATLPAAGLDGATYADQVTYVSMSADKLGIVNTTDPSAPEYVKGIFRSQNQVGAVVVDSVSKRLWHAEATDLLIVESIADPHNPVHIGTGDSYGGKDLIYFHNHLAVDEGNSARVIDVTSNTPSVGEKLDRSAVADGVAARHGDEKTVFQRQIDQVLNVVDLGTLWPPVDSVIGSTAGGTDLRGMGASGGWAALLEGSPTSVRFFDVSVLSNPTFDFAISHPVAPARIAFRDNRICVADVGGFSCYFIFPSSIEGNFSAVGETTVDLIAKDGRGSQVTQQITFHVDVATTGLATTGSSTTGAATTGVATTGRSTTGMSTSGASTTGALTTGGSTTGVGTTGNIPMGMGTTGTPSKEPSPSEFGKGSSGVISSSQNRDSASSPLNSEDVQSSKEVEIGTGLVMRTPTGVDVIPVVAGVAGGLACFVLSAAGVVLGYIYVKRRKTDDIPTESAYDDMRPAAERLSSAYDDMRPAVEMVEANQLYQQTQEETPYHDLSVADQADGSSSVHGGHIYGSVVWPMGKDA